MIFSSIDITQFLGCLHAIMNKSINLLAGWKKPFSAQ